MCWEAWSRRNIKTSFPNSGIFLFESMEGWWKKQDKTSKQTSDHQTNQSGRSKRSLHESQGEPRGERDVIRLQNPTEDKRAFRRMLTSADRPDSPPYLFSRKICTQSHSAEFLNWGDHVNSVPDLAASPPWIRRTTTGCFKSSLRFFLRLNFNDYWNTVFKTKVCYLFI